MFKQIYTKWIDALYSASVIMICMTLGDHLTSFIMEKILKFDSIFSHDPETFQNLLLHQVIAILIGFSLIVVWKRTITKIIDHETDNLQLKKIITFISFFTCIIYFAMIVYVRLEGSSSSLVMINTLYLSIYFLLFIVSLLFLIAAFRKRVEMKEKEVELNSMKSYTDQLEKNYTDMRRFRHDYINILSSMSEYIVNRDIDSLENYFNNNIMRVSQEIKINDFKLRDLSNIKIPELKSLISSKVLTAQEQELDITFECTNAIYHVNMDSVSLCRCVGILLDNAIEAATESSNTEVRVGIIVFEQSVSFIVWNTFRDEGHKLFKYFEKGFSTKGNNRGLGLSNLKEILKNERNVQLDTHIERGQFKQEIKIIK
ncbi:sensor histidine kinase [Dellaglioa sp. L3N]